VIVGKLHLVILNSSASLLGIEGTFEQPPWIPDVSFTWWGMIGALVVFSVGVLFRTPDHVLASAAHHARQAQTAADLPLALREPPVTVLGPPSEVAPTGRLPRPDRR